jgi:3-oxoacyl-[acyl-carrier-protein] synthase II
MNLTKRVAVVGMGLEIPGITCITELLEYKGLVPDSKQFDPAKKLGKKGLRYKDTATKLALCSAKEALQDASLPISAEEQTDKTAFGVVASSNLGNVDTICRVVETIRHGSVNETSAMDLPNASSNVIATTLAIRFGLQNLNLMVCNGTTSGTDALWLGANNIRVGRGKRMLVVGVEVANSYAQELIGLSSKDCQLLEGAGAIVLEDAVEAQLRGARIYGYIGRYGFCEDAHKAEREKRYGPSWGEEPTQDAWFSPSSISSSEAASFWSPSAVPETIEPSVIRGAYGALGVLQAQVALTWLRSAGKKRALITSGAAFGDRPLASIEIVV